MNRNIPRTQKTSEQFIKTVREELSGKDIRINQAPFNLVKRQESIIAAVQRAYDGYADDLKEKGRMPNFDKEQAMELLARFEVMCRSQKMATSVNCSEMEAAQIFKILLFEFDTNLKAFDGGFVKKLYHITLRFGAIGPDLAKFKGVFTGSEIFSRIAPTSVDPVEDLSAHAQLFHKGKTRDKSFPKRAKPTSSQPFRPEKNKKSSHLLTTGRKF